MSTVLPMCYLEEWTLVVLRKLLMYYNYIIWKVSNTFGRQLDALSYGHHSQLGDTLLYQSHY